jgi:hypothetical protein
LGRLGTTNLLLMRTSPAGADLQNCGELRVGAEQSALEQAQGCVLDAVAAKQAFELIHWLQGYSAVVRAYASGGGEHMVSILLGNYEVSKEGGYRPCCDGLRQVYQLSAGYGYGDQNVCTQPVINVFACIEGSCGDGRCEAPEAVGCGCTLDCQSAVWGAPDAGVNP